MGLTASVDVIDALLPQTQCTRCGYNGCLPYAQALARGKAVRPALDQVMADESAALREGAEVAFFPPVTGG